MVLVTGTILVQKSAITPARPAHGEEKGQAAPASELARNSCLALSLHLGLWVIVTSVTTTPEVAAVQEQNLVSNAVPPGREASFCA